MLSSQTGRTASHMAALMAAKARMPLYWISKLRQGKKPPATGRFDASAHHQSRLGNNNTVINTICILLTRGFPVTCQLSIQT